MTTLAEEKSAQNPNKRREWVKNAIIVFLLIMLILTFFSNTIMNYSLPEVSVTRMQRSSVSKKYELDLYVEANKTYDVTADESRDIKRVAVKRGQEVKEGQVIFYLEKAEDSAEVKQLESTIKNSKLSYEKAIMKVSEDYFNENMAISQARDALNAAIAARDAANSVGEPVDNSGRIMEITNLLKELEKDKTAIETEKYSSMSTVRYQQIQTQYENYETLNNEYNTISESIASANAQLAGADETSMQRQLDALKTELKRLQEDNADARVIEDKQTAVNYAEEDLKKVQELKKSVDDNKALLEQKEPLLNQAQKDFETKLSEIKDNVNNEYQTLSAEKEMLLEESAGAVPDMTDYDARVRDAQYALDSAVHMLEEKMQSDKLADAQTQLDLNSQKEEIEKLEKELEELVSKQTATEILSPVDGVVEEILVMSGQSCMEGDSLMKLNISEEGFTAKVTLDADKGKTLKKGEEAKIVNSYDDITATIKSISKDKNDSNKFSVVFTLSGDDVVAGQNVRVELGEKSASYDNVLPKSAVKTDADGLFVYAVKSKSTPLGNRYIVEKVAVTKVAEDDTHYAVSGDFGESADYIITASSKPFKAGDQVRFAEE